LTQIWITMKREENGNYAKFLQILFVGLLFHLLVISPNLFGQSKDCSKFKNGTFKLVDSKLENYIIVRKGKHQTESYADKKMKFIVKWIDDCTYTLTPTKKTMRKNPNLPKDGVLTVTIIEVKEISYIQTSTSNFSTEALTKEMIKIK